MMGEVKKANNDMSLKNEKILREQANKYKWYHTIKVANGIYTDSVCPDYKSLWDFNLECMKNIDFKNKRVLDIGCRDGLFSFEAEKRGAREIIGIDNDISKGATEFLIPLFKSNVQMYELNLYDLTPEKFGLFDIIIFFGVLYHLRYPFWGLKKVIDCLSDGGTLLLESGMLVSDKLENKDFLYCPVEESPYDPTSCTFFNKKGLSTTMRSLNLKLIDFWTINLAKNTKMSHVESLREFVTKCRNYIVRKTGFTKREIKPCALTRQFFIFNKDTQLRNNFLEKYWDYTHTIHT